MVILAACSSLPTAQGDHAEGHGPVLSFSLSGRFAIRQDQHRDTVLVRWEHAVGREHLTLSTPLGNQVMLLEASPGHARLTLPDRAPLEAADAASLMRSALGYALPVQGLAQWVSGTLPLSAITASEGVGEAYTVRFSEDGWTGVLERWREIGAERLPGLITIERDDLHLRLVVDSWSVIRAEP